jgi:hypothetical protein
MIRIYPPAENDSMSRIALSGTEYYLRFTYNASGDWWSLGIYDKDENPILDQVKIVPMYPLNLFHQGEAMPRGLFLAWTDLERIGKEDLTNGNVAFEFVPYTELMES